MSDMNKVWDKVQKMVRMGNCEGASEAEREIALRMAYKVLAQHNLSMSDMPAESNGEERVQMDITISADKWARDVCVGVAKLFFAKYFFCRTQTAGKDLHCFIGLQSNAITAMNMSEFVIKAIKKESSKRYGSVTSPGGRSFCVGTSISIYRRIKVMLVDDDAIDAVPGTAVALIRLHDSELTANEQWLSDKGTKLKEAKQRTDKSLRAGAYYDGKDFGKTISLNRQVTSTGSHAALK